MYVSRIVSSIVQPGKIGWILSPYFSFTQPQQKRLHLLCFLFLLSLGCTACSGFNLGGSAQPTKTGVATPASVALMKLRWCGKPLMLFRDEGVSPTTTPTSGTPTAITSGTPPSGTATATTTPAATAATGTPTPATTPVAGTARTITDWTQVEPKLGFSVYLPTTLPGGTCLTSASGTINDPIFGGSFTIGYVLPDRSSISLSEAPLRSQSTTFQCSMSSSTSGAAKSTPTAMTGKTQTTQAPVMVCTGARDTTSIVFAARGTTDTLEKFFQALQTSVNWIPAA